jgi:hypothetical protein
VTNLLRARVCVDNELAVDDAVPERHLWVLVMGEVQPLDLAVGVVAINLIM